MAIVILVIHKLAEAAIAPTSMSLLIHGNRVFHTTIIYQLLVQLLSRATAQVT
jgi:hypothetical protein